MKMREMRMEKISWVKREMNRTRKLPSTATMMTTMTTSHIPTQIRPTMYSMLFSLQNWCGINKEHTDVDNENSWVGHRWSHIWKLGLTA